MTTKKTPSLPHVLANVLGLGPDQALRVETDRARELVRSISGPRAQLPRRGRAMLMCQPGMPGAVVLRVIEGVALVHHSESDPLYAVPR